MIKIKNKIRGTHVYKFALEKSTFSIHLGYFHKLKLIWTLEISLLNKHFIKIDTYESMCVSPLLFLLFPLSPISLFIDKKGKISNYSI